ncbi:hypothetical protein MTR67_039823 [Solanum verrucosum]|uniref:Integrase zinc-binding domain-containing protein n=1 Tax=Solanum verrucosum TaxID=315347 RepID=A0AAF0UJ91_SOLVR|nr:hypothetical protein MTR67_039823 [Solanum verrucosum]
MHLAARGYLDDPFMGPYKQPNQQGSTQGHCEEPRTPRRCNTPDLERVEFEAFEGPGASTNEATYGPWTDSRTSRHPIHESYVGFVGPIRVLYTMIHPRGTLGRDIMALQDKKDSHVVVIGTLQVFHLEVYAFLDPWATLSFVTPYILVNINIGLEGLLKTFSVSTPVCDPFIARRANVVAETLNILSMGSVAHVEKEKKELAKDVHRLARLGVCLWTRADHQQRVEVSSQGGDGATKMYRDLHDVYWWNDMKRDIIDFVTKCPNCQHVNVEHQKPRGVTQEINIPTWKWEVINMDFIMGLSRTRKQHDSIWVIVDRFTMSAHLLAIKTTDSVEDYTRLYMSDIVRLHKVPLFIILDKGVTHEEGYEIWQESEAQSQVRRFRNKEVALVKVLWRRQPEEGATWEAEESMMAKYSHLFPFDSVSS